PHRLSLHDALPIYVLHGDGAAALPCLYRPRRDAPAVVHLRLDRECLRVPGRPPGLRRAEVVRVVAKPVPVSRKAADAARRPYPSTQTSPSKNALSSGLLLRTSRPVATGPPTRSSRFSRRSDYADPVNCDPC